MLRTLAFVCIAGALAALMPETASAQAAPPGAPAAPPNTTYSAPVSTQPLPDELQRARLIWSVLVAVQQANESGNYSVLRDISSPGFQAANDPSKLSTIFAGIRSTNIDLSNTLLLAPTYTKPPEIDNRGMMHLEGGFGLRPTAVLFSLTFQWVSNRWKLFGIALGARSIASGVGPAPAPAPAPPKK